jgi:hypothetical protein
MVSFTVRPFNTRGTLNHKKLGEPQSPFLLICDGEEEKIISPTANQTILIVPVISYFSEIFQLSPLPKTSEIIISGWDFRENFQFLLLPWRNWLYSLFPFWINPDITYLVNSRQDSLDGRSARHKAPTYRQHKHRTQTDIHASSGIRTHDPSVWAGEDISCLRPRGHSHRIDFPVNFIKSGSWEWALCRYLDTLNTTREFVSLQNKSQNTSHLGYLHSRVRSSRSDLILTDTDYRFPVIKMWWWWRGGLTQLITGTY